MSVKPLDVRDKKLRSKTLSNLDKAERYTENTVEPVGENL